MSTTKRWQAIEALGDGLQNENDEIETPAWHETILLERKAKIASGSAKFFSLSELKRSLIFPQETK